MARSVLCLKNLEKSQNLQSHLPYTHQNARIYQSHNLSKFGEDRALQTGVIVIYMENFLKTGTK